MEQHISLAGTSLHHNNQTEINIHNMPGGVVLIDQQGKITDANQAWYDIVLRDVLLSDLQFSDDYFEIRRQFNQTDTFVAFQGINRVLAGIDPEFNMQFFCRFEKQHIDMNAISVNTNQYNVTGKSKGCAIISHRPHHVGKQHFLLPERVIGERCFDALYEQTEDGVLITHYGSGQVLKYNKALQDLCGFNDIHLHQMTLWELIPSVHHNDIQKVIFEDICLLKSTANMNTFCIHKDNRTVPVSIQAQPLTDKNHNLVAISWFIAATEQSATLEPVSFHPLSQTSHWAESNVTHDLNNILSVIMMNAELLESTLSEGEFESKAITNIQSATQRATRILSQMSLLNSLPQLDKRPICCMDWLAEMNKLETQLNRSIDVHFEGKAEYLSIYAHPTQLKQLLTIFCRLIDTTFADINAQITLRFAPARNKSNAVNIDLEFASPGLTDHLIRQLLPLINPKKLGRSTSIDPLIINSILQELYGAMEIEHKEQFLKIRLSFPSQ